MSGGHFDYQQYKLREIAESIFGIIEAQKHPTNDRYFYSKKTLKEFKKAYRLLRLAEIYEDRIDWLVCGDDGEDTFQELLKEELDKFNQKTL